MLLASVSPPQEADQDLQSKRDVLPGSVPINIEKGGKLVRARNGRVAKKIRECRHRALHDLRLFTYFAK